MILATIHAKAASLWPADDVPKVDMIVIKSSNVGWYASAGHNFKTLFYTHIFEPSKFPNSAYKLI